MDMQEAGTINANSHTWSGIGHKGFSFDIGEDTIWLQHQIRLERNRKGKLFVIDPVLHFFNPGNMEKH